jgi:hypothetical protein
VKIHTRNREEEKKDLAERKGERIDVEASKRGRKRRDGRRRNERVGCMSLMA